MKKASPLVALCFLVLAAPLVLRAQSNAASLSTEPEPAMQSAGTREFTLGGGGASNKAMDDSTGSLDFAYGSFLSPAPNWCSGSQSVT